MKTHVFWKDSMFAKYKGGKCHDAFCLNSRRIKNKLTSFIMLSSGFALHISLGINCEFIMNGFLKYHY